MSKKGKLYLAAAILLFLPCLFYGQSNEMVVPDYIESGGTSYLDAVIAGDTSATGGRANADRIYVLKRDGVYFAINTIRNTDWTLRIQAQSGTGAKPVIYSVKNPATGNSPSGGEIFDIRGHAYFTNLSIVGWSEFNPDELSTLPARIMNVRAAGFMLRVDNCLINGAGAAQIQVQSAAQSVKITNTKFSNAGNLFSTNIGNGRPIDFRNTSVDTVLIQNCSMLNITDRAIRHYSSIAALKNVTIDHNTFANELAMHGCLGLGWVGNKVTITNNLFVDNFILGADTTDGVRASEFIDTQELAPNGRAYMYFVVSTPNDTTSWTIKNNYYSVSPAVQAFYDSWSSIPIGNLMPLSNHLKSKAGVEDFVKLATPIVFTDAPAIPVPFAQFYSSPTGANKAKVNTGFTAEMDMERKTQEYFQTQLNLAYALTSPAYSGAENGFPAGDLNWFPARKADWENGTSVEKTDELPTAFALEQNYPNPFNPATKITYSVLQTGHVKLEVFDILGKHVATLIDQEQQSGQYRVDFDGSKLSSGVYVYRLSTQGFELTKKMMLMK